MLTTLGRLLLPVTASCYLCILYIILLCQYSGPKTVTYGLGEFCDLIVTGHTGSWCSLSFKLMYIILSESIVIFPFAHLCLNQLPSPNSMHQIVLKRVLLVACYTNVYTVYSNSINVNHLIPAFCVWAKHSTWVCAVTLTQLLYCIYLTFCMNCSRLESGYCL